MGNPYLLTIVYFVVSIVAICIFMFIFKLVTKYKDWIGIKNGNVAIAMETGGKIFGIANIFRFSIIHNDTIWQALIWGGLGFILLLVAYLLFDFLTPWFKVDEEVEKDNRAVGLLSMIISIGLSYVIGASIT